MHQGGDQSRTPRLPEPPSFDDGADERTRVQPAVAAAVEAGPPTQQQPVVPDDAIFRAQRVDGGAVPTTEPTTTGEH